MKLFFQIGFNKCGTKSLHKFFLNNDINSIHWGKGKLANKIYENKENGVSLLSGYEEYQAFTDMEDPLRQQYVAIDFFKELYQEYPEAIFIFNDRNLDDWIESRTNHMHGQYPSVCMKAIGLNSTDETKDYWRKQHLEHKQNVLTFFGDKVNFIYFKIDDENSTEAFIKSLLKNNVDVKNKRFPHAHKTFSQPRKKSRKKFRKKPTNIFKNAALNLKNYLFKAFQ